MSPWKIESFFKVIHQKTHLSPSYTESLVILVSLVTTVISENPSGADFAGIGEPPRTPTNGPVHLPPPPERTPGTPGTRKCGVHYQGAERAP